MSFVKLYFYLFLRTGGLYGILMIAWFAIIQAPNPIKAAIMSGLFFGTFMSLILGTLHIFSVKQIAPLRYRELLGVHHTTTLALLLPYNKVFERCLASLNVIGKHKIEKQDHASGKIIAKTGMGWKSSGEIIEFTLNISDEEVRQVTISSKPKRSSALVDNGKGLENIRKIEFFLQEHGAKSLHLCIKPKE